MLLNSDIHPKIGEPSPGKTSDSHFSALAIWMPPTHGSPSPRSSNSQVTPYLGGSLNKGILYQPTFRKALTTHSPMFVGAVSSRPSGSLAEPAGVPAEVGDLDGCLEEVGHSGDLERLDLARREFPIHGSIWHRCPHRAYLRPPRLTPFNLG